MFIVLSTLFFCYCQSIETPEEYFNKNRVAPNEEMFRERFKSYEFLMEHSNFQRGHVYFITTINDYKRFNERVLYELTSRGWNTTFHHNKKILKSDFVSNVMSYDGQSHVYEVKQLEDDDDDIQNYRTVLTSTVHDRKTYHTLEKLFIQATYDTSGFCSFFNPGWRFCARFPTHMTVFKLDTLPMKV